MNKKMKYFVLLVLTISLMVSVFGCNKNEQADKVVAEYKGGTITQQELDKYMNAMQLGKPEIVEALKEPKAKKKLVEELIMQEYLTKNQKLTKEDEDQAKQGLETYKTSATQTQGEAEFKKQLKNLNISDEDLLNIFKRSIAINKYLEEKSDSKKMESVFKENANEFTISTVSHILVDNTQREDAEAKKRADEVLAKVKAGGDFTKLAKEYSDDPGSKEKGGTYENMPIYQWVPEFKEAILKQKVGEISSAPVKTNYGYHIIKVITKKVPAYQELTDDMKSMLKEMTKEAIYNDFMSKELPTIITKIDLEESSSK